MVYIQPSAIALHSIGPQGTVLFAENVLDACGIEASLHVARLDLHGDWHGIEFKANERSNFVTYSDRRSLFEVGEELSGMNFGKRGGDLFCRIYDKTRESDAKGTDWWPDVWGPNYEPQRKVMRVEFEFRRSGLVQFSVDTPADAIAKAPELWAYAACKWLSLRVPTGDETRSRWPVDARWELVQRSSLAGGCAPAVRIRAGQREGHMRTYRKLITGVASSMAVPMGTTDIGDTLMAVEKEMLLYEQVSNRRFDQRVAEKRQKRTP